MTRRAPSPIDGTHLTLLFGMPRSGTTWIGKLFDSHPDVLYRHEPDSRETLFNPNDSEAARRQFPAEVQAFAASLPSIRSLRVAGKKPLFPKAFISGNRLQLARLSTELARVVGQVYSRFPVLIHHDGRKYPDRAVVWKSVQSLTALAPTLEALGRARGIHILRHPCGYIASVLRGVLSNTLNDYSLDWAPYRTARLAVGTPLGDRFGFDENSNQMLDELTLEERLAWHWTLTNEKVLMEVGDSDRYLRVYYEQVCQDPLAGVESMFKFAGLELNPQSREFIAESTGHSRADYYSVYKDPEAAAWRWREELDEKTVDKIMAIAGRSEVGTPYVAMQPPGSEAS
jgi:hypothetical protein